MKKTIKIITNCISEGKYQYIGLDQNNETELFKNTFDETTEGIAEFTGAVHGLMFIKKNGFYGDILVKNVYIKECLEKKEYKHNAKGIKAEEFLGRCKRWLLEQSERNINIKLIPDVSENFAERKTWFNRD